MKKKGTKASRFFSGEGREYIITRHNRINLRDVALGFVAGVVVMDLFLAVL